MDDYVNMKREVGGFTCAAAFTLPIDRYPSTWARATKVNPTDSIGIVVPNSGQVSDFTKAKHACFVRNERTNPLERRTSSLRQLLSLHQRPSLRT